MVRTLEASLEADGTLTVVGLPKGRRRRVLVTVLDESPRPLGSGGNEAQDRASEDEAVEAMLLASAEKLTSALPPEDFSDWPGYAEAEAEAERRRKLRAQKEQVNETR